MAQIIQYKDRERDASVYPITVGAAVYMSDGTTENVTLDNIIARKVDSISIVDDPTLQNTGDYPYVPTTVGSDGTTLLDDNLQKNARINIGVDGIITGVEKQVGDIKQQVENKQDRLETGVNIKFINGFNILGPGTLDVYKTDTVIGIDSSLIVDSSNAIMNSTVTQKFNDVNNDLSTLRQDVSTNISNLEQDIPFVLGGKYMAFKDSSSTASGNFSTALGASTVASANNSFASGVATEATNEGESSFGKYNKSKNNTLFSVGNGTENSKMNLLEVKTTNDIFLYSKVKDGYVKLDDIIGRLELNVYSVDDLLLSSDMYDISALKNHNMPLTTYFDRTQNFITVYFKDLGERHFYIPQLPSTNAIYYSLGVGNDNNCTVKVENDNITFSTTTGVIINKIQYGMTPKMYTDIVSNAITTSLYYNFSDVLGKSYIFYLYSGDISADNNLDFECKMLSSVSDKSITKITDNDSGHINLHRYGDNFSVQSLNVPGDYYPFMCTTNVKNTSSELSFDMFGGTVGPVMLKVTDYSGTKTIYLPICIHDDSGVIVLRLKTGTIVNTPLTIESINANFNSLDKIAYMGLSVKVLNTSNVYSTSSSLRTEVCPFKCYSMLTANYHHSNKQSSIKVNVGSSHISFMYDNFKTWANNVGASSGYNCPVYFVHGSSILFVAVAEKRTGITYLYNCDPDNVQFQ